MISIVLLLAAIVCACWAALIDAGHIDVGAALQLFALSLAFGFAALAVERVERRYRP